MPNNTLVVTSTGFEHNGYMPVQFTGYGTDQSPPLSLRGLSPEAKALAIIMVDLDIPFIREYPHWLIWNLPAKTEIPGAIPRGETLAELSGAVQGLAYGKHEYKGPRPPGFIRTRHRYDFTVYALDSMLAIHGNSNKKALQKAMEKHVIQQGAITGIWKNAC